jgi:hypothetical protein
MIGSSLTLSPSLLAKLRIGVGFGPSPDLLAAVVQAAVTAQTALEGATPHLAVVVTVGVPSGDVIAPVRAVLGPVGVAGGVTSGLLIDRGCMTTGALVIAVADAEHAASGVSAAAGRDLTEAGRAAARLMLAGWPFRHRYPRGLGFAFGRPGYGAPAATFLDAWRELMGPKMRTVCATMPGPVVFGSASSTPIVSVACLEASYSTGLGFADGFSAEQPRPDAEVLTHGSVDAALTALKRLEEDPLRLVVVIESAARREALGKAADAEWTAIRQEVGERAPCVGWLCEQVAAYGRGVRPVDVPASLVVAAIGDPPDA